VVLSPLRRPDLSAEERDTVLQDLVREITALWQTDELRRERPTPIDGEQRSSSCVCLVAAVCSTFRCSLDN
jgi:phosphoenolpyruvate carboxylase